MFLIAFFLLYFAPLSAGYIDSHLVHPTDDGDFGDVYDAVGLSGKAHSSFFLKIPFRLGVAPSWWNRQTCQLWYKAYNIIV